MSISEIVERQYPEATQMARESSTEKQGDGDDSSPQRQSALLAGVASWEKTDVQFWIEVGQLVLLAIIAYKLSQG